MLYFDSDYNNGCHEKVLENIVKTNHLPSGGYGDDDFTVSAKNKICKFFNIPDADIYFISGGTQTNSVVISSILDSTEGVIAANTGHIASHEAGAIEYGGHKVISLPSHEGRIDAHELSAYLEDFSKDENINHMVRPGMVYISFPTEYGTLYSYAQLKAIHNVCKEYDIPLYIDGARLGYALASPLCDISVKKFPSLCDIFYIGGTKVGALCGEAVVFPRGNSPFRFFTKIKQRGALMAKGRLIAVQFDALFTDNLYIKISRSALEKAEKLKEILKEKGYRFYLETPTNQQFVILGGKQYRSLSKNVRLSFWENYDSNHSIVRFCTSWSTSDEEIDDLREIL